MRLKRIFDVVCAILLMIITSPVLAIVAISVRITSRGPIIFKQKRIGQRGKTFTIFKFRTLYDNSERPVDTVLANDSRITSIGKFLRCSHFDELPQLWNIFRGDMSMVGPRPTPVEYEMALQRQIPGYENRLVVKPGLTGVPQALGTEKRRRWGFRRMFELDIFYIEHWSFLFDLYILWRTLFVIVGMKGI